METQKTIVLLISMAEVSQAFSIGIFLMLLNRKKKNSLLLLGMFLFVLGLSLLPDIINYFDKDFKLGIDFFVLVPALLYSYVDNLVILKKSSNTKIITRIGITGVAISIVLNLFFPFNEESVVSLVYYFLYYFLVFTFMISVFVATYRRIKKNNKRLKNQYSSTENRDLLWVSLLLQFLLVYFLFAILEGFLDFIPELYEDVLIALWGLFFTFWASYHGLLQQVSKNLILEPEKQETETIPVQNEKIIVEDKDLDRYKSILKAIETLMEEKELYLNSDLTIVNVSEHINEHPRLISKVINTLNNENFNSFINSYRVEKAKIMLLNEESNYLNIEGIGNSAGFKSNSSFYTAFKKHQKMTPSKFIKSEKRT